MRVYKIGFILLHALPDGTECYMPIHSILFICQVTLIEIFTVCYYGLFSFANTSSSSGKSKSQNDICYFLVIYLV